MNAVLLLLRSVIGLLFIGHGTQKLFGWFGGGGVEGTGSMMHGLGYRPGKAFATLGGLAEAGGGLLLTLGLLTPVGSAATMAMMLSAILSVHWTKGIWNTKGGLEYPLVMATVAFAIAFIGPRRYSLDRAIGWRLHGWAWAIAALMVAVAVTAVIDGYRRSQLRRSAGGAPTEDLQQPETGKHRAA